jgi:hypothetical protein
MKGLRRLSTIFSLTAHLPRSVGTELESTGWMMGRFIEELSALNSMEIFLIVAWELWKIRNRYIFDGVNICFNRWLHNFKDEVAL